jgi:hypothetical protein
MTDAGVPKASFNVETAETIVGLGKQDGTIFRPISEQFIK